MKTSKVVLKKGSTVAPAVPLPVRVVEVAGGEVPIGAASAVPVHVPYPERARRGSLDAAQSGFALVRSEYAGWVEDGHALSRDLVAFANRAAGIGRALATAVGREQFDFGFWKAHCEGQLPFDFEKTKEFISIGKKLPRDVKTLEESKTALQPTFFAAGLLQVPSRTEPQSPNDRSPLVNFTTQFSAAKVLVQKWLEQEPVETWPESRKASMRAELKWAVELAGRLGGVGPVTSGE